MKKNYEKIYKRLIKEIKRMIKDEEKLKSCANNKIMQEVEKRASEYAITVLNCVLEMNDEINGTKCHRSIMSTIEFDKWKERIIE